MGFGTNSISLVTRGLRRGTGGFAERMVSAGLVGTIQGVGALAVQIYRKIGIQVGIGL